MKRLMVTLFVIMMSMASFAQNERTNAIWTTGSGDNELRIGGYAAINTKYSTFEGKTAGYADFKVAAVFNSKYSVGLSATGLYYDKKLRKVVSDGTYHIYAGYVGLFLERMFTISDDTRMSVSLFMGQGEVSYEYDKEYREQKPWYQEVIDREKIHVTEPSVEVMQRISGNFWLGLTGSYRMTSDLNLVGTPDDLLRTFSGGISFKYGVF